MSQPLRSLDDHSASMHLGMKLFLMPDYHRLRTLFLRTAQIRPDDRVLDFGCGVGLLEAFLVKKLSAQGSVVGVDVGEKLLGRARKTYQAIEQASFCQIDGSGRLPFKSGTFDLILTNLVCHLLDRSQKQTVFAEFCRILKPGGKAVLAEIGPAKTWLAKSQEFLAEHVWARLWPYEKNSLDSYKGLVPEFLRQAGFNTIEMAGQVKGFIDLMVCRKEQWKVEA